MKVIKRAKNLAKVECQRCGSVYIPTWADIEKADGNRWYVDCPVCTLRHFFEINKSE